MDLIILILFICIILYLFRSFDAFVYFIALVDILLRILTFIRESIALGEVNAWIAKYIPSSIKAIIDTYSTGVFNDVLSWGLVICFIIFEYHTIRIFLKKR